MSEQGDSRRQGGDPDDSAKFESGCPFHNAGSGDETTGETASPAFAKRAVDRRSFLRTALAIGGVNALSAVSGVSVASGDGFDDLDVPQGSTDPSAFPERQHAWNQDIKKDPFGNVVLPNHQLILFLDCVSEGRPTQQEREKVEAAFRTLERAFQRLSGGDPDGDNDGLVFMVGYSPTYFDQFEGRGSNTVDLIRPEEVLRRTNDDPEKADNYDAVVLLSSASVPVLLGSELALFGELDTLNGVSVRGSLDGIFETAERRTAFVGKGLPHDNLVEEPDSPLMDEDPGAITNDTVEEHLNEDAPLSMGYKSGFKDNVATEDAATITTGPFKEGTTVQVSKLELDLGKWYENDRKTRDQLMFSHEHSPDDLGDIGEELGDDSGITEEVVDSLEETAKETGQVGHAAKTAQARNEDFEPLILRRSEGVNNALLEESGMVGFNFSAVMESIEDFIETRQAMNASHLDEHVEAGGHGILPYMEVTNRATFLVPPRKRRSLPRPLPMG